MSASKSQYYSGFDPRMIPCNVLWLDGADPSSLTLSGTNVLRWRDKSGRGYDASSVGTPTYVSDKLNGYGGILLTTTNGWMIGSSPLTGSNFSGFVVADMSANAGNDGRILSLGTIGTQDFDSTLRSSFIIRTGSTAQIRTFRAGNQLGVANIVYNQPFVAGSIFTGSSNTVYRDGSAGTTVASSGSFGFCNYGLGKDPGITTGRHAGHIYEVLLYQDTLSTQTRQAVEGYLASKWGIQSRLPSTHPNTKIPPFLRPFAPVDISGCTLLLDSADSASLTLTGSTVSTWVDKSGSGRNATPYSIYGGPTFSNNDARGIPAVTFNGSDQALTTATALPVPRALFVVGLQTISNRNFMTGIGTDGTGHGPYYAAFKSDLNYGVMNTANAVFLANNSSTALNTDYILTGVFNGSNAVSASINGGVLSNIVAFSGTPKTPVTTIIGANWYNGTVFNLWPGKINEYIAFSNVLSLPQREQIEGYLAWKWKLLDNLPSTHGYKLYPPMTPAFNPLSFSNCVVWLDSTDRTTIDLSGTTGYLLEWRDKSGNGRHAFPGVVSRRPLYVNNGGTDAYVRFDPTVSAQYLSFSNNITTAIGSNRFSIFIVEKRNSNKTSNYFMSTTSTAASNIQAGYLTDTSLNFQYSNTNSYTLVATTNEDTNPRVLTFVYNGAGSNRETVEYGVVRTSTLTAANITIAASFTIGCGTSATTGRYDGNIYEFLCYVPALTSNQRQQVEGYLAHKWGRDGSFNDTHPYKRITP
jgi:hypothetical protein